MSAVSVKFENVNGTAKVGKYRGSTILEYPCSSLVYCGPYEVTLKKGTYRIECWGASAKAKGAYARGNIFIQEEKTFYIHIGASAGLYNSAPPFSDTRGGYNGGGATDVRYSPLDC